MEHPDVQGVDCPTQKLSPIVTAATKKAIKNLCKPKMAFSLWQTKKFVVLGSAGNFHRPLTYTNFT